MKNKKRPICCNHHFEKDDTTSSGEFICSYFIWMTPNQQKQRAEELNKMTKKIIRNVTLPVPASI